MFGSACRLAGVLYVVSDYALSGSVNTRWMGSSDYRITVKQAARITVYSVGETVWMVPD
jgi:hypothetical protein